MSFKKLFLFLFSITLVISGMISLINNINFNIIQENFIPYKRSIVKDSQKNKLLTKEFISIMQNENSQVYYKQNYFYHTIGLDSNLLRFIDEYKNEKFTVIFELLSDIFPSILIMPTLIIKIIIIVIQFQWKNWDILSYDHNNGIQIEAVGFGFPLIIIGVSSQ